jgi:nanoRNase/pAp phosphatase (c-di-AMP/oligoRNAs hydrolase)
VEPSSTTSSSKVVKVCASTDSIASERNKAALYAGIITDTIGIEYSMALTQLNV